jgi:hypothetical protein
MALIQDRDFEEVEPGSLTSFRASPDLESDEDFRGIRIRGPARVSFGPRTRDPLSGAFAHIVVCGAYHFDADYLGGRFLPRLVVVAVDARTHVARAGIMEAVPNQVDVPDPPGGAPPGFSVGSVVEYFNPNLATLLDLPEQEARYVVYAALGSFVSNVLVIDVRKGP